MDQGIPVDSVIEIDNGNLYVDLPDEVSCEKIAEFLQKSHNKNKTFFKVDNIYFTILHTTMVSTISQGPFL